MPEELLWVNSVLRQNGLYEAVRVLDNLDSIMKLRSFTKDDRRYISPTKSNPPYPLYKVLICMAFLRSHASDAERANLRESALMIVNDHWYERLLGDVAL